MENSIVAFLLVRQSCAEGAHVFPAYPHWFLVSFCQVTSADDDDDEVMLKGQVQG